MTIYLRFQQIQKLLGYIVLFLQQINVSYRHIAIATLRKDRMCQCKSGTKQCVFSARACNFKAVQCFFCATQYFFMATQWLDRMKQWLDKTSSHLEGLSRWLEGLSRQLEETSRWLEGSSRWLEETSRWLDKPSRWLEETSRWLEEIKKHYVAEVSKCQYAYQQYYTLLAYYDGLRLRVYSVNCVREKKISRKEEATQH